MKKLKSIPVCISMVLFSLVLVVCSCNKEENPVIPNDGPYEFDSSRYSWETDTIFNQFSGIVFGLDTTHVYIIGTHSLTFFDGVNYTRHSYGDLYFNAIDGFDPMHIYIAGAYPNGDNRLMKWDGSIYQDIPTPKDTSLSGGLSAVYAKSANEIWLGSKGKIFLLSESLCTEYQIDSAMRVSSFVDSNNELFAFGRTPVTYGVEVNVYLFDGNLWNRIYSKQFSFYEEPLVPIKLGNELYGCQDGLLKFNDSDFSRIIEPPSSYNMAVIVAGNNSSEFLTFLFNEDEQFFANWNENKWSREEFVVSPHNMNKIDRNYYIIESPCSSCNFIYLRIGRPNF